MKLKEISECLWGLSSYNQYLDVFHNHNIVKTLCHNFYASLPPTKHSKVRYGARKRYAKIIGILKTNNIPIYRYGNNDAGYAYRQEGVAINTKYINQEIANLLMPNIDYIDLVAYKHEVYVSVGIRWNKDNYVPGMYSYSLENMRFVEKYLPKSIIL